MSIRRNLFAFSASQLYVALVGIVMLPVYVNYMGVEAYGLVGFFVMLQAWFQLLDMGLTPTMTRETARLRGGGASALSLRKLLRSLEGVFLGIAFAGALALMLGADGIARRWLKVELLSMNEVASAIRLMALVIVLRWIGELYRGVIAGCERMQWLGALNASAATARFVLVLPFLVWIGHSAEEFFLFQLCVAAVEAGLLMRKAYSLLPVLDTGPVRWSMKPLRGVLQFSLAMAFANLVWVAISQSDKLLLSGLLSLTDYGRFTLCVLAASGLLMLASPIVAVLMPRLTVLHAQANEAELLNLYRKATQWVGLLSWPACSVLALQADRVLWVWTGDQSLAAQAALTLSLYALGNGVMALGAFPYYLQFAKGRLRLHLVGTFLFVMALLPALVWAAVPVWSSWRRVGMAGGQCALFRRMGSCGPSEPGYWPSYPLASARCRADCGACIRRSAREPLVAVAAKSAARRDATERSCRCRADIWHLGVVVGACQAVSHRLEQAARPTIDALLK